MKIGNQAGRVRAALALGVAVLATAVIFAPAVRGTLISRKGELPEPGHAANTPAPAPNSEPRSGSPATGSAGTLVNPGDRRPGRFASSADSVVVYSVHRFDHTGPTNSLTDYDDTFNPDSIAGWRYVLEVVNGGCTHAWIGVAGQEVIGSNDLSSHVFKTVDVYPTPGQSNDIWVTVQAASGSNRYVSIRIVRVQDPTFRLMRDSTHVGPSPGGGYVDTFTQVAGDTLATVRVVNGDGSGFNRVTGATLKLNGVQVFGTSDFNTGVAIMERQASLRQPFGHDTLTLTGEASGKQLTVRVLTNDVTAPVLTQLAPALSPDTILTTANSISFSDSVADEIPGLLYIGGGSAHATPGTATESVSLPTNKTYKISVYAVNRAKLSTSVARMVIRDSLPPTLTLKSPGVDTTVTTDSLAFVGNWADSTYTTVTIDGDTAADLAPHYNGVPGAFNFKYALDLGSNRILVRAVDALGNKSELTRLVFRSTAGDSTPGSLSASTLSQTGVTPFLSSVAFLYRNSSPSQSSMDTTKLDSARASVIRGRVIARDMGPIANVAIQVLGHPEYGYTISRSDGTFDLLVNGGAPLVLRFTKSGYLESQRQISPALNDFISLDDIAIMGGSAKKTTADSSAVAVVRSRTSSDANGDRNLRIVVPRGFVATVTPVGGSDHTYTHVNVRAKEYTVASDGSKSMPAILPPGSAYTYCVDLRLDEADQLTPPGAVGANTRFSKRMPCYVRNFLSLPVGSNIPVGYYDQVSGQWKADSDGVVLKFIGLNASNDTALVDSRGTGTADPQSRLDSLGITGEERAALVSQYSVGDTLWRASVNHFTTWDFNYNLQQLAALLGGTGGRAGRPQLPVSCPVEKDGSIIECENRVLGERIPVVGTAYSLNYRSFRAQGDSAVRTIRIPVIGGSVPDSLQQIIVRLDVAGQVLTSTLTKPSIPANAVVSMTWNGLDAYGRAVPNSVNAKLSIGYQYNLSYLAGSGSRSLGDPTASGNGLGLATGDRKVGRTVWTRQSVSLGAASTGSDGLGDWTISPHHFFDLTGQGSIYLGDGSVILGDRLRPTVSHYAGGSADCVSGHNTDGLPVDFVSTPNMAPSSMAIGPDGSLYTTDVCRGAILKIDRSGLINRIAGNQNPGAYNGDTTTAATSVALPAAIGGISLAPDGSVYFYICGTSGNNDRSVLRLGTDGKLHRVIGSTGTNNSTGDGGPASSASVGSPCALALGPDGSLFVGDSYVAAGLSTYTFRVRRIAPNGIINAYAGRVGHTSSGVDSTGPATKVTLLDIHALATDSDGNLYIVESGDTRICKVAPDGMLSNFLLEPTFGDLRPKNLAFAPDGSAYITSYGGADQPALSRVWKRDVDGSVSTIAGGGLASPNGVPAVAAAIGTAAPEAIAIRPDGSYFIASGFSILRVATTIATQSGSEMAAPSADGSEIFYFDATTGRHLRTRDALTGAVTYTFGYDALGALTSIRDANGDSTLIHRSGEVPTSIESPYHQSTTLGLDGSGNLSSVQDPIDPATQMTYWSGGLLKTFQDPVGNQHSFDYASDGRLLDDSDPGSPGGTQTLGIAYAGVTRTVTHTSGESRATTYAITDQYSGTRQETVTEPSGLVTTTIDSTDARIHGFYADSTTSVDSLWANPRAGFGMVAPVLRATTEYLPSGKAFHIAAAPSLSPSGFNPPSTPGTWTETVSLNGRTAFSSKFDSNSGTRGWTSTSPLGRASTTSVDTAGRPLSVTTAGLSTAALGFDSRGRVTHLGVGGRAWRYTYDSKGRLASVTDTLSRVTGLTYDDAGRLTQQTLPDTQVVNFGYDSNGNLSSVTPPGGLAHGFDYTAVNLTAHYTPPDAGIGSTATTYTYNKDRQLTNIQRPDSVNIVLAYETSPNSGRLASVSIPRGAVTYKYRATGQLDSLISPDNVRTGYSYDGPLVVSESRRGEAGVHHIDFTYDSDFRPLTEAMDGGNSVTYRYDLDGLLASVGIDSLHRVPSNLASTGFIDSTALAATGLSATSSQDYTSSGELANLHYAWSGGGSYYQSMKRDSIGRITTLSEFPGDSVRTYTFTYTTAGRLKAVDRGSVHLQRFDYDANGNRTAYLGATPGDSATATYDGQDRMLRYGNARYSYSKNGELTKRALPGDTTSYTYDELGNLLTVVKQGGARIDYLIDGENRRVGKKLNGVLQQLWLYEDGLRPVAELDTSGNVVSQFVYGSRSNVPDYMVKGGSTYRLISDQLGSVRLVVNASSGAIAQSITYDPWGRDTADSSPGFQPFGFAGGLYDPDTKLVRFGARDYDAGVGRWTSKDRRRFSAGSANLYMYVFQNPLNLVDPTGLDVYVALYPGPGSLGSGQPGAGHLGIGLAPDETSGLYPADGALNKAKLLLGMEVPGVVKADDPSQQIGLLRIRTSKAKDEIIRSALVEGRHRARYKLVGRHCGDFVRDLLLQIGIDLGADLTPDDEFDSLVDQQVKGGAGR